MIYFSVTTTGDTDIDLMHQKRISVLKLPIEFDPKQSENQVSLIGKGYMLKECSFRTYMRG